MPFRKAGPMACFRAPVPFTRPVYKAQDRFQTPSLGVSYGRNLCPALVPIPGERDCLGRRAMPLSVEEKAPTFGAPAESLGALSDRNSIGFWGVVRVQRQQPEVSLDV